jgi:hypothetical protein
MQDKIGYVAGSIWEQLEKNGEMTPKKIQTSIKEKSDVVYLALGWLARENKVSFQPTKTTFRVKLGKDK